MSPCLSVFIVLGVCLAAIGALYLLGRAVSVSRDTVEVLPFQSGWRPREHALSRFHARWYPLTLVFLAFDVEMLFMFPWALVVAEKGPAAIIEMFVFLGVLVAGVVWAWREGAFRWV
ncbi:NADH-quinone oxidoreductase subunit A [Frigoribacterium sp. CG_9.8]|uniref:NADH-quinone oxidoreductase subunit A n=1 Tax=Frigoribacterium sp. CG_9.8 TaxID=2787733 RepID=UPI001A27E738|nr:NADH-quinone oxidoreductase subunit A [Frigoribacterium sp. CG_9.8]MBG6109053.1 NADH-quinone oxidoreductase subunit A [Frigoribacterium sp. CG_9.8]